MEENPYKAPREFDIKRKPFLAAFPRLRTELSRFPAHYWYWVLALIASHFALTMLFFVFQAKGLPYALLKPYYDWALYALVGLWGLAGLVIKVYEVRKLYRNRRRNSAHSGQPEY